ncbi:hypothetical protein ACFYYR_02145 [Streptomyces sp. NPDC001922]|uniref:hypothetical protein n=1 Tax=Streptomyces sp. NPDC001922 TaxID=3364624 RepID=UPI0036AE3947
MPTSSFEEADDLLDIAAAFDDNRQSEYALRLTCPPDENQATYCPALLKCPACGSAHVAQVLGDNGGISYVCTACGHCWS